MATHSIATKIESSDSEVKFYPCALWGFVIACRDMSLGARDASNLLSSLARLPSLRSLVFSYENWSFWILFCDNLKVRAQNRLFRSYLLCSSFCYIKNFSRPNSVALCFSTALISWFKSRPTFLDIWASVLFAGETALEGLILSQKRSSFQARFLNRSQKRLQPYLPDGSLGLLLWPT